MSVQRLKIWQDLLLLYFATILLNEELASEAMMSSSCPPSCKCDVSRKYVTCFEDRLNITSLPFLFPNDTRQLEIRKQSLPVLNASMFANLAHLRKLLLSASCIQEIENDFTKLQKLKRLDLSENKLGDLVFNTIGQMKQLKELILDDNLLTLAGNNVFISLENIELLSLSGNQIEDVPPLRGLEELQKLYLSNNFIQTINGSTFNNLYKLEELYLQGNLITQLEPGWANNLHVLRHLDLSENILGVQPSRNVIGLQKNCLLETLSLSDNSLLQIPCHDISRTKYLIKLNLSYNNISNLENGCLNKLTNLEIIDLKHNKIENIENKALQSMPTL
ncbi:relaxin receptor 2-like, partial [Anneissia japonica]|uniref:relaxin receptor 2-like n=1 Tax=Anneissia japonica TaxID=1529436 RepID=UPI00142583D0